MKNGPRGFWKLGKEEFNTQFFNVNRKGELVVVEGLHQYNIAEIARKHNTPITVLFPHILEARLRRLMDAFNASIKKHDYRGKFFYHYPMKVNQRKEFVLPLVSEGANLETSSANELWLVKRLWSQERFSSRIRVLCNGPKTEPYLNLIDDLDRAGLAITPIIEEIGELEHFRRYKGEIGIRVDLDVKIRAHWDKKFNHFGLKEEQILSLGKVRNLAVLSYHISSQIEKIDGFTTPVKRAVELYAQLLKDNPRLDTINIGGGGGVPYLKRRFYTGRAAAEQIVRTFKQQCAKLGVREPNIICEWGRFVAAPAQITVFRVCSEKPVAAAHAKKWYTIDGSIMNDLPDTWGVHQKWHITPANNLELTKRLEKVWLAGASCDSDDKYTAGGGHIVLPKLADTDRLYIVAYDTGAYQDALASRHCLLSRPVRIVARDGEIVVTRRRDTPEEIGKSFGW
jgi:arginine decarboxylase